MPPGTPLSLGCSSSTSSYPSLGRLLLLGGRELGFALEGPDGVQLVDVRLPSRVGYIGVTVEREGLIESCPLL